MICTKCSFTFESNADYEDHLDSKFCELNEFILQKMFGNRRQTQLLDGIGSISAGLKAKLTMKPWLEPLTMPQLNMATNFNEITADLDEKRLKSPRIVQCPDCEKDFHDHSTVYGHHIRVHGTEAWLRFRLRIIPVFALYIP